MADDNASLWLRLRMAVFGNLGLKAMALLGALLLFALVRGSEDETLRVFVSVEVIQPSAQAERILVSEVPDKVRVTLTGSRSVLNSIRREDLDSVTIDLSDTSLRYYYFDQSTFGRLPPGVTITQIVPASIPLTWAEQMKRDIQVRPSLTGDVGEGLMLRDDYSLKPETVSLVGPRNEVELLTRVDTEPLSISNLGEGRHVRQLRLAHLPTHTRIVGPDNVQVVLEIASLQSERRFSKLDVVSVGANLKGAPKPPRVEVVVSGNPADMSALESDQLVPWVDASNPELEGTVSLPLQVRGVPEGVNVVRVEPSEVFVTINPLRRP